MSTSPGPLSEAEFHDIYSKVPRLTVEVIIKDSEGRIFITQRAIEPCKGQWHIPGGTVCFGESLLEAVQRISKRELGITVEKATQIGVIEYPSHYLHGLDSPVGIVFEVSKYTGKFQANNEAMDSGWFAKIPDNFHADQSTFLIDCHYLST